MQRHYVFISFWYTWPTCFGIIHRFYNVGNFSNDKAGSVYKTRGEFCGTNCRGNFHFSIGNAAPAGMSFTDYNVTMDAATYCGGSRNSMFTSALATRTTITIGCSPMSGLICPSRYRRPMNGSSNSDYICIIQGWTMLLLDGYMELGQAMV